jgi:hypothetical protein
MITNSNSHSNSNSRPPGQINFDPAISARLREIATAEEIATLHRVLDDAGRLRCPWWYLPFVVRIVERLIQKKKGDQ